jgi:hypothetical protein
MQEPGHCIHVWRPKKKEKKIQTFLMFTVTMLASCDEEITTKTPETEPA